MNSRERTAHEPPGLLQQRQQRPALQHHSQEGPGQDAAVVPPPAKRPREAAADELLGVTLSCILNLCAGSFLRQVPCLCVLVPQPSPAPAAHVDEASNALPVHYMSSLVGARWRMCACASLHAKACFRDLADAQHLARTATTSTSSSACRPRGLRPTAQLGSRRRRSS